MSSSATCGPLSGGQVQAAAAPARLRMERHPSLPAFACHPPAPGLLWQRRRPVRCTVPRRALRARQPSMASASGGVVVGNLLAALPAAGAGAEQFTELVARGGTTVQRIVSTGHASADWYDQDTLEFVLVTAGEGVLQIEGEPAARIMGPGDWMLIPPHTRHRVVSTHPDQPTIWLAVHMQDEAAPSPAS
jgi:cupin 2 domain-containing protein